MRYRKVSLATLALLFVMIGGKFSYAQHGTGDNPYENQKRFVADAKKYALEVGAPIKVGDSFDGVCSITLTATMVNGQRVSGSGTCFLAEKNLVVSALHLSESFPYKSVLLSNDLRITIIITGQLAEGRIPNESYYSFTDDLLAVRLGKPVEGTEPLTVANQDPEIGKKIYFLGYDDFGMMGLERPGVLETRFVGDIYVFMGYAMTPLGMLPINTRMLKMTPVLEFGFSGGAGFNENGEVVGIALMQKTSFSYAVTWQSIKALLNKIQY